MKYLILVLIAAGTLTAWAANPPNDADKNKAAGDKGNGGTAVVCFNSKRSYERVAAILRANEGLPSTQQSDPLQDDVANIVPPVRLYDLAEHERKEGAELIAPESNQWKDIVKERMKQIGSKISFSSNLEDAKEIIKKGGEYYDENGVVALNDVANATAPQPNCALMQVAFQRRISKEVIEIHYDRRLLKNMPPIDRAALDFHERVVAIVVGMNSAQHKTLNGPVVAQTLVGDIFDKEFESVTGPEFLQRLVDIGWSEMGFGYPTHYEFAGGQIDLAGTRATLPFELSIFQTHVLMSEKSMGFLSVGNRIRMLDEQVGPLDGKSTLGASPLKPFQLTVRGAIYRISNVYSIYVRASGSLALGYLTEDDPLAQRFSEIGFSDSGYFNFAILANTQDVQGNHFLGGQYLKFNEDGTLQSAYVDGTPYQLHQMGNGLAKCWHQLDYYSPSGALKGCESMDAKLDGVALSGPATFYEDGKIEKAKLVGREEFIAGNYCFSTGNQFDVEFYPSGNLLSCYDKSGTLHHFDENGNELR